MSKLINLISQPYGCPTNWTAKKQATCNRPCFVDNAKGKNTEGYRGNSFERGNEQMFNNHYNTFLS